MKAEDLKASLLQHAVQGKLVPQDSCDEPIQLETSLVYEGGKILDLTKKGCVEIGTLSWKLPTNWILVRGRDIILKNLGGATPSKSIDKYWGGSIKWASVRDLHTEVLTETERTITREGLESCSSNIVPKGNLIVCTRVGLGKIVIAGDDIAINQDLRGIILSDYIDQKYFINYYKTQSIEGHGSTVKGVTKDFLENMVVPLPPLAEQKRIVAKLEELQPLIDTYARNEEQLTQLNTTIAPSLRKSLLLYAIQGKLVPQDSNDEPASALLSRIHEEKQRLIREGKLKKNNCESKIYRKNGKWYEVLDHQEEELDVPFDIPDSWEWIRLGSIVQIISDGTHKTPKYIEKGVPFVSVKDISQGFLDFSNVKYISPQQHEELTKRCAPSRNDILICRIGTLGKALKIETDQPFSIFVSLGLLRLIGEELIDYVVWLINSPLGTSWINSVKVGGESHTNKINLGDLPSFLMPIPPLAEQKRIQAKLIECLNQVERLEN